MRRTRACRVLRRTPCRATRAAKLPILLLGLMTWAGLTWVGLTFPAGAQEPAPRSGQHDRGTIRFGASWQDYTSPEHGLNLRAELILPKPDWQAALPALLIPAPIAGLSGHIGHGTSFLYAGALWTLPLTSALFIEGSLAVAANNGFSEPGQGRAALGCRGGVREEAGIGWRFDAAWSIVATVEHYSNAHLCNHNRGLTNLGVMLGRTF